MSDFLYIARKLYDIISDIMQSNMHYIPCHQSDWGLLNSTPGML